MTPANAAAVRVAQRELGLAREEAQAALASFAEVQMRLSEAEETLRAIRNGEVDALVVRDGTPGAQVFTLSSADRPYRIFVENMHDGAATVSEAGTILYANRRLGDLVDVPLAQLMGSSLESIISGVDRATLRSIGVRSRTGGTVESNILTGSGRALPVRINCSVLDVDLQELLCLTFADLSQQHAQRREIERLGLVQADRMKQLEEAQAALTEQATHDTLTGLPNRNLLMDRLTQLLATADRSRKATAVMFVDLDGFKEINDTRGHAVGDVVLRQVSERLLATIRPMDSVARLGGDEFVVLLPDLEGVSDAIATSKRITAVLESPLEISGRPLPMTMTASIGITISHPSVSGLDGSADKLLREADTAMYKAKRLGGSRTEIFDAQSMTAYPDRNRDTWITRIREALDQNRFVLHAQPIVELATRVVVQHELLLRMRDHEGNLIPPLAFLPSAERSGLIIEIDEWVIATAAELAARGPTLDVNLSAASTGEPHMLRLIERELETNKTDPRNLVFEITETNVIKDIERARDFADQLVALGCRVALDDFGTGFATLTHLKQLPAHYLKIDIDFVRNLTTSSRDTAVIRAIVALAADFGQQTVAEGVEDDLTARLLLDLGVTHAQGYLFGHPAPMADGDQDRRAFATSGD
jgi:diguanylate cyclase (GGDEF)-like protein